MGGGMSVFCSVRAEGRSMLLKSKQGRAGSEAELPSPWRDVTEELGFSYE